jgi:hypothetical protein
VEISAALHERFIPRLWGNEQRPADEKIVIELDHLSAREMAELEYTLNDGGIYRKMYDYPRIAKKIHGISGFSIRGEKIDTAEKLLAAKSRKAAELLKEIIFHLFYKEPDEEEAKN